MNDNFFRSDQQLQKSSNRPTPNPPKKNVQQPSCGLSWSSQEVGFKDSLHMLYRSALKGKIRQGLHQQQDNAYTSKNSSIHSQQPSG